MNSRSLSDIQASCISDKDRILMFYPLLIIIHEFNKRTAVFYQVLDLIKHVPFFCFIFMNCYHWNCYKLRWSKPEQLNCIHYFDKSGTSCQRLVTRFTTLSDLLQVVPTIMISSARDNLLPGWRQHAVRGCGNLKWTIAYLSYITAKKCCRGFCNPRSSVCCTIAVKIHVKDICILVTHRKFENISLISIHKLVKNMHDCDW